MAKGYITHIFFSLPLYPDNPETHQIFYKIIIWVLRAPSLETKQPDCKRYPSPPPIAEVKNVWRYISTQQKYMPLRLYIEQYR
jgi:hypothetical protein